MRHCIFLLGLFLVACSTPGGRNPMAVYDLGDTLESSATVGLGRIEVATPAWLATSAMQYRLPGQPGRRYVFAESRWAAAPGELLETALRHALGVGNGHCRLLLELDDWIQDFSTGDQSQARLALRARLVDARGALLAWRAFTYAPPAGQDARSGAVAYGQLEKTLATDLRAWITTEAPPDRCRG
ncbi:MAG TPA: ABC-type transport auxiliary lipoprotein family protein [Rhodocyclaceae bacterium]|nr:ABC-type transport auxiliary lipoprotein family protein [Rhodocyclaceae bacterium]